MEAWLTVCVLVFTFILIAVAEVRVCRLDADCRPEEYCTGVTTLSDGYCVPMVGARPCVRDLDCPVDEFCSFQGQVQQGFCTQRLSSPPVQSDPVVVGYPFGSLQRCFGDETRGDRSGCPAWEYCSDQTGRTEGYCLGQDCYSNLDCEGATCNGGAVNPRIRGYCSLPLVQRTSLNLEPAGQQEPVPPAGQQEPVQDQARTTRDGPPHTHHSPVIDGQSEEVQEGSKMAAVIQLTETAVEEEEEAGDSSKLLEFVTEKNIVTRDS